MKMFAQVTLNMISAAGGYGIADYYITMTGSTLWWMLFLGITAAGSISVQILRYSEPG